MTPARECMVEGCHRVALTYPGWWDGWYPGPRVVSLCWVHCRLENRLRHHLVRWPYEGGRPNA